MKVTKIEELDKKRIRVSIDEEFAFVLYKGELRIYNIEIGNTLSRELYEEIITKVLPKRAKLRCMNLLKSKAYTEKQLKDKLKNGEYPEDIIAEALEYVKSYGYVNDRAYAEDFIEYNKGNKSRKRMEQDLLRKGIAKDIISGIFEQMKEEGNGPEEFNMAAQLLRKKNYDVNTATFEEKRKLAALLYRKGFESDTIRRVLLLDITSI